MSARKTVVITPTYTVLDPMHYAETPADALGLDAASLVARVSKLFTGEGVILLDAQMAKSAGVTQSWTTYAGDPRVYLGRLDDLDGCPLINPSCDLDTAGSFALFHELMGVAYHRSPGVAGLSLLQHLYPRGKTKPVVWESPQPAGADETRYFPSDWHGQPAADDRWLYGYDRRRAGLAALQTVEVARYGLKHYPGQQTFRADMAGWWLCEVPTWNDPRMPNPAGYGDEIPHRRAVRWLTTPTINLLQELADQGLSEGVQHVHGAWLAPKSRLFAKWVKVVEGAYQQTGQIMRTPDDRQRWLGEDQDAARVREAIKQAYRETAGMFTGATSWVKRHDWWCSAEAMNRATMWRTAWAVGQQTGRWPTRVDGDKWWYGSSADDPIASAPTWTDSAGQIRGIVLGDRLGMWRHDGTKEIPHV